MGGRKLKYSRMHWIDKLNNHLGRPRGYHGTTSGRVRIAECVAEPGGFFNLQSNLWLDAWST